MADEMLLVQGDPWKLWLANCVRNRGAADKNITAGLVRLGVNPPQDYLEVLKFMNGCKGFVANAYLHLYSLDQMIRLNQAYQVARFAPGLVLFGSNGGGQAFAFDKRTASVTIVTVPFIPLSFEYASFLGSTFSEFIRSLMSRYPLKENQTLPGINRKVLGKEVHELQPVVFGGNPTDPKNKVIVTPEEHAQLCVFWNNNYQRLLSANQGPAESG